MSVSIARAVGPLSGVYFRSQSRQRPHDYARFIEDDFARTKLHAL